jgi:hypothetical protein
MIHVLCVILAVVVLQCVCVVVVLLPQQLVGDWLQWRKDFEELCAAEPSELTVRDGTVTPRSMMDSFDTCIPYVDEAPDCSDNVV